jgi:hypothetical protein
LIGATSAAPAAAAISKSTAPASSTCPKTWWGTHPQNDTAVGKASKSWRSIVYPDEKMGPQNEFAVLVMSSCPTQTPENCRMPKVLG